MARENRKKVKKKMNLTDALIRLVIILACHFVGDYVLQTDFIAKTKGENRWHMFIHCFLYVMPFLIIFWFDWRLPVLFISHFIIDTLKSRYKKISYPVDQILHLAICIMYFSGLYPLIDY